MRADRLLALLLRLQSRGKLTASELAGELEVSIRTIYRDLQALAAAGVPVLATGGPGGGCQLLAGYRNPLLGIGAEEATALLAASGSGPLQPIALGDALADGQRKVLASLPPALRESTARAASRFHLDPTGWFRVPELVPQLETMVQAVLGEDRLRITHQRANARPRTGVIDPLGLVAKAGVWYLVGLTRGNIVAHRAARITDATPTGRPFHRPPDFDLAGFWDRWTMEFESGFGQFAVVVRMSPAAVAVIPEVLGQDPHPDPEAGPENDGWLRLTLYFDSMAAARRRLLGFGPDAEVLEPAQLRTELADTARRTVNIYRSRQPHP